MVVHPACFHPHSIEQLLGDVRARLKLSADCEITMEANPGTFERERFRAFRAAGVTRLSIGVQSFSDDALKAIGRVHDGAQAAAAVAEAVEAFDTCNIDIMYALPGQTVAACTADVDKALAMGGAAHLAVPPHDRGEHPIRQVPAGLTRGGRRLRHARPYHRAHRTSWV